MRDIGIEQDKIKHLNQEIVDLQNKWKELEINTEKLQSQIFKLDRFMKNTEQHNFYFYTGFESWDAFMIVFCYLNPGEKGQNIRYWHSSGTNLSSAEPDLDKGGKPRSLRPLDENFLTMCCLGQGFHEEHLAHLFGISLSTVRKMFISCINFIFFKTWWN